MDRTLEIETLLSEAGWLRRLAASLVGDTAQAEDLVQDAWVAALRRPPGAAGTPRPWLRRVVRNLARNAGRDRARREAREAAAHEERADPDPAALVQEAEAQRLLAEAVTHLAEPLRAVIVLRYFQGLESSAAARRLGVPASTVRTRLQKALEELRTELDRRFEGGRRSWGVLLAPLVRDPGTGVLHGPAGPVAAGAAPLGAWPVLVACASAACVLAAIGALTWTSPARHEEELAKSPVGVRAPGFASAGPQESASQSPSVGERRPLETRPGSDPLAAAAEPATAAAARSDTTEVSGTVLVDGRAPEWPVQLALEPTLPPAPADKAVMRKRVKPLMLTLAPEQRGAFSFGGLSPGWSGRLVVIDYEFAGSGTDGKSSLRIDAPASDLVLELRSGPEIVGRILGADGRPIPDLEGGYQLRIANEGEPAEEIRTRGFLCRTDGRFRIPGQATGERASLTILVESAEHGYLRRETPDLRPATGHDLGELVLEPLRALAFTLRDPAGMPLEGGFARVDGPSWTKRAPLTDAEGSGVLDLVPDRPVEVRFSALAHADRVVRADPGNALEVVLEPLAVLELALLGSAGVRAERLLVSAEHEAFVWDTSGWDGSAELQLELGGLKPPVRRVPGIPGQRFEYEFRLSPASRFELVGLAPDLPLTIELLDADGHALDVDTLAVARGQRAALELGEADSADGPGSAEDRGARSASKRTPVRRS